MDRSDLLRHIRDLYQSDRLHPVTLIWGRSGIGKGSFALDMARLLLCESASACRSCVACQLVSGNQHGDFLQLGLERNALKTADVDQILEFSSNRGLGGNRVVLLPDVERLTTSAANRLLKTLEEPPAKLFFLLTSSALAAVLPTIRSRAAQFHLKPLPWIQAKPLIQKQLAEGCQPDDAQMLLSYVQNAGSLVDSCLDLNQAGGQEGESGRSNISWSRVIDKTLQRATSDGNDSDRSVCSNIERGWNGILRHWLGAGLAGFDATQLLRTREFRELLDALRQKEIVEKIKTSERLHSQSLIWQMVDLCHSVDDQLPTKG